MRSLALAWLSLTLLTAAPAGADDIGGEKATVDARIATLQAEIAASKEQEGVLSSQLSAVVSELQDAQSAVDTAEAGLSSLEANLSSAQERLDRLDARLKVQARRLERLRAEYERAVAILESRVRAAYIDEPPDLLSFLVSASSFDDLVNNVDFLERLGKQDQRIARTVEEAKTRAAAERLATVRTKLLQAATVSVIAAQTDEARDARDHLAAESATLAARIQAAQGGAGSTSAAQPSAAGLIWPCDGVVTSGFGTRWGRMHEGIDIACAYGAPAHAAAAGTVIYSGWLGGYGNIVVVDHGNGLSTAYAHASAILVSVGQSVAQGESVALVGSTGHSTGPHLHFEVRINGVAVDPLLYL